MSLDHIGPRTPDITVSLHWGVQRAAEAVARALHNAEGKNPPLTPEAVASIATVLMAEAVEAGAASPSAIKRWMARALRDDTAPAETAGEQVASSPPWEG